MCVYIYIYIYICIYIYIYHIFFIHSSVNGQLHVLAMLLYAAMNTGVHISFFLNIFIGVKLLYNGVLLSSV